MFQTLYQIAKNTFRENLREPIFLLILVAGLVLIGILPAFTLFVFREQLKLVVDSAMAGMLSFGWVLAVLCASHAINQEMESGTAILLLAKPVTRPVFIVGKIIGIVLGLTVFCFLTGLASLIALRVAKDQFRFDQTAFAIYFGALALGLVLGGVHNYIRRSSFPMAAVLSLLVTLPVAALIIRLVPADGKLMAYSWHVLPALVLVSYAVWTLGILATALSTRLALIPNLLVCAVVFMTGLLSDFLLGAAAQHNAIAALAYALIPNWQLFWMADALAADRAIPLAYIGWGGLYVVLFATAFTLLAICLFHHREVGRQSLT